MQRSKPEQDHTTAHLATYKAPVSFLPIGRVRSPYRERFGTPRQPTITEQVKEDRALDAIIELNPDCGWGEGLVGLAGFSHVWVIYTMHLNDGARMNMTPIRGPRQTVGLWATRSPHRPNPIGLSCVRLVKVEDRTLHIQGLDMLDGSPVLDIKPYVPYADAFPDASTGWMKGRPPTEPDRFEPV